MPSPSGYSTAICDACQKSFDWTMCIRFCDEHAWATDNDMSKRVNDERSTGIVYVSEALGSYVEQLRDVLSFSIAV